MNKQAKKSPETHQDATNALKDVESTEQAEKPATEEIKENLEIVKSNSEPENLGGRPAKFSTKEELDSLILNYFKKCENRTITVITKEGLAAEVNSPVIPTIAGLAYELGVNRQTIYNYAEKNEFIDSIKQARNYILGQIEGKCVNTDKNAGGAIFILKNYGYEDKREIATNQQSLTLSGTVQPITQNQLERMIAALQAFKPLFAQQAELIEVSTEKKE
jgi:hypothetical protein